MQRTLDRGLLALTMLILLPGVMGCISVQESNDSKTSSPPLVSNVSLDSLPGMSEVYVNGEFRGTSPVRLQLEEGTHEIEFRLRGYESWGRELVVKAGDDTNVVATLERETE